MNTKTTKRQIFWLIILAIYTIGMIIFMCIEADRVTDLTVRRISAVLLLIPFLLILFCYFGFPEISFPTKKNIAMMIKSRFSFLENSGYSYSHYVYNKKQKALELYFTTPDFVNICVVYLFKSNSTSIYMIVGEKFVSFRQLEDMYCEKLSNEERDEMSVEDYIEYVLAGVVKNKDEILRIQSCWDFIKK